MKAKSILILVFGITFFLFSCNSDNNSTLEEPEKTPIQRDCSFSQLYADQIEYYKNLIPVLSENLDTLFLEWSRNLTVYSFPFQQVKSIAYPAILNFCLQHEKAILPLIIEKVAIKGSSRSLCLLKDLTYVGDVEGFWSYVDSYCNITEPTTNRCKLIIFQEKLLEDEEENIQKSIIQYLIETEDEALELDENIDSDNSNTTVEK